MTEPRDDRRPGDVRDEDGRDLPFDDGDVATQPAGGDRPPEGWPAVGDPEGKTSPAANDEGGSDTDGADQRGVSGSPDNPSQPEGE